MTNLHYSKCLVDGRVSCIAAPGPRQIAGRGRWWRGLGGTTRTTTDSPSYRVIAKNGFHVNVELGPGTVTSSSSEQPRDIWV